MTTEQQDSCHSHPTLVSALAEALAAPFDPEEVKWKPGAVAGERALALAYVDARVVMDRLDEVLGVDCWQDVYEILPDGAVLCTLRVRIGGEWITKTDVGGQSEQPDGGDRCKAAVSDALKRTAVKLGIGRYLYRLPSQWCDYDPRKKQFKATPRLPAWALPAARHVSPRTPVAEPGSGPASGGDPPAQEDEIDRWYRKLESCQSVAALKAIWVQVPAHLQADLAHAKDGLKANLQSKENDRAR